jgi:small subunit ribosomal protein S13
VTRLVGVDLSKNKRIEYALTSIYGIGLISSQEILKRAKIDFNTRVKDLSEESVVSLRNILKEYHVEGDLRREVTLNIKRLQEIVSYRGLRHKKKLPVRGQRTHTNARTRRGKKIAVAGKKKPTR